MPIHAVIGHLAIILAPMAAVVALVYSVARRSRRGMRWPLVTTAGVTMALVVWAEAAGDSLIAQVKAHGSPGELADAMAHAKGSDDLATASFALLAVVLVTVWWLLRPDRPVTAASHVAAVVLAACALAVLITTATTLRAALHAVWAHHPSWSG